MKARDLWGLVVLFIIICVGGICVVEDIGRKKCYTRYASFQPEYAGPITGCMITVDEERVPADSFRMTL